MPSLGVEVNPANLRDAGRVDHRSGLAAKLKVAKDVGDEIIEKSLYQRAKGYSYRAEKVVKSENCWIFWCGLQPLKTFDRDPFGPRILGRALS